MAERKPFSKKPRTAEAIEISKQKTRLRKARYRCKPEARAKQVAYVAERRAAIKERRRHWDPPKESRAHIELMPPAKTITHSAMGMLTSAEEFAVSALMDMAIGGSGTPTNLESRAPSSLHAVFEEGVADQAAADGLYSTKPLPPYASPATPLQNKHWRKEGIIGPITGIQHVQILVAELAQPPSDAGETELDSPPADPPAFRLSMERRQYIQSWISDLPPPDLQKDREARRAAMELHLDRWIHGRARSKK